MTAPSSAASLRAARAAVVGDAAFRGRALCRTLSEATDAWLRVAFEGAAGDRRGIALVAVGGYGRGELAPGSDLDLWLVHDDGDDVAVTAERLWYPVWDAGLKLGHAVRTVKQALALAADDLDTATAVLSARTVAGDPALGEALADRGMAQWRKRSARWLKELSVRVAMRHEDTGELAFLLEPDVKEGRGGLRDIHALRWAESARPVLHEGDDASLALAEDTLLEVRVELHRAPGRPSEVLVLERQDEVAAALGDADADALMARVAAAARTVAWTGDEVWARVGSSLAGPVGRVFRRDRPLGPGLVLREGEVHVDAGSGPDEDPTLVIRAAAAAARAGTRIDRPSLDRLAAGAPALEGPWPAEARGALVELLGAGHDAIPVFEALDQRGLVERVLPEWAPTRSKPQRNALHRFTVDRHLCETAANAAALTWSVSRPDLLLVGAWLHDLGKGYPGDHTAVGVELMSTVAPRMSFDEADTATLVDLVRHHLLLPDVATRRDLGDDSVIESVAGAVGTLETLQLLAALTEADGLATGPSAWGSWKAELVGALVDRVAHVLRGGRAEDVTGEGYPGPDIRQLMAAGRTLVRAQASTVDVVAPDRPGTLSRVAGALSLKGLTVLAADAASSDGMAASTFRLDAAGADLDWDEVAVAVRRALDGRLALEARLVERGRTWRRQSSGLTLAAAPSVRIDNAASATATVVEVRAPDGAGVLYRITRALADLDLDIRMAKVSTLGSEVLDTFYVTTRAGEKVTDRLYQRELERAVIHQLSLV